MKVNHVSASQLKIWKGCKAQWKHQYLGGKVGTSNSAADFGTAIHETLEAYVQDAAHISNRDDPRLLEQYWWESYHKAQPGLNSGQGEDGRRLLGEWWSRQDWSERTVLEVEQRREMMLPTQSGDVPLVYIIDRIDQVGPNRIDIIDYKSGKYMLSAEKLKHDMQAKIYAMAVWTQYPDQDLYWVKFDYLRGDPIGVAFRPEQLSEFRDELVLMVEEMQATKEEDAVETVYEGCRFCPMSMTCETLRMEKRRNEPHANVNPSILAARRLELMDAQAGIKGAIDQVDRELLMCFERDEDLEHIVSHTDQSVGVTVGSQRRRAVDVAKLRDVLPAETLVDRAALKISDLEALAEEFPDKAKEIKEATTEYRTRSSVRKVENLSPF